MPTFSTGDVLPVATVNAWPRSNMLQEDAILYPIPIFGFRWEDGNIPDTTGAAGKPALVMGGYGSGTGIFQGEDAQAALKTETLCFDFVLPECYVSGQTVTVTVSARYNDSGTNTISTKTIDCECYKIDEDGTADSDICATAVQTLSSSMESYSFDITATSLSAGNLLRVFIRTALQGDSNGVLKAEVGGATVELDIKG